MSATFTQVQKIAAAEIGYIEQGGPDGCSGNITKFGKWYGIDGQPWCAMFISWVFFMAGLPLPASTSKGFAYCPSGASWFQKNGWWSRTPKIGFIVFFSWDGKRIDHVGLVIGVNSDGTIITIEGNTSSGDAGSQQDGGGVHRRVRDTAHVVGYGIPQYAPEPAPQPTDQEDVVKHYFYKIRDENNISQPAPSPKGDAIYVTSDWIHSKFVDGEAWVHQKNLNNWPAQEEATVELIPETLHNWLIQ